VICALFEGRCALSPIANGITQIIDDLTGVVTHESHWVEGKYHRDFRDGPARIIRDRVTGVPVFELFLWNGKIHRPSEYGPARIIRDPATGIVKCESYWVEGLMYRSPIEGPVRVIRNPKDGTILKEEFSLSELANVIVTRCNQPDTCIRSKLLALDP
jgi:hypothetical protein